MQPRPAAASSQRRGCRHQASASHLVRTASVTPLPLWATTWLRCMLGCASSTSRSHSACVRKPCSSSARGFQLSTSTLRGGRCAMRARASVEPAVAGVECQAGVERSGWQPGCLLPALTSHVWCCRAPGAGQWMLLHTKGLLARGAGSEQAAAGEQRRLAAAAALASGAAAPPPATVAPTRSPATSSASQGRMAGSELAGTDRTRDAVRAAATAVNGGRRLSRSGQVWQMRRYNQSGKGSAASERTSCFLQKMSWQFPSLSDHLRCCMSSPIGSSSRSPPNWGQPPCARPRPPVALTSQPHSLAPPAAL